MRRLIENYPNAPGEHCGSVAMRSLLRHYCALDLPEPAVFGLGAGLAAIYLSGPGMDPQAVLFGRTLAMELDLGANLQVDYRERPEPDDDEAWRIAREEILAGRPSMLSGDIFYLDYRDYKVHFPSHRFVLLGFDDEREEVYIADRIRTEPETCSLGALRLSRNPPEGISTHNLWGRFHDEQVGRTLRDAAERAIAQCARTMLARPTDREDSGSHEGLDMPGDPATRALHGIEGIRAYARDLPSWRDRDDAAWIAGFNASCLEKFGNGGGNFRRLYADFLDWARVLDPALVPASTPALARRAADAWTATSNALYLASQGESTSVSGEDPWREAAHQADRAAEIEAELFGRLADADA